MKVQKPVPLSFAAFPRQPDLPDCVLHTRLSRKSSNAAMYSCMHSGQEDTAQKYNGAPYIIQRAGEAVYSEAGKAQIAEQIAYYHKNASYIFNGLKEAGYTVAGGVNSPYVWLKTPEQMNSWEFFDYLLEKANVVGTPGSGFGPSGEGYFRLTAFGTYENTVKAIDRIKKL